MLCVRLPDTRKRTGLWREEQTCLFIKLFSFSTASDSGMTRREVCRLKWLHVELNQPLCPQLTKMNLANRMLSRESFTLSPPVQHAAASARGLVKAVHSGAEQRSSTGWVIKTCSVIQRLFQSDLNDCIAWLVNNAWQRNSAVLQMPPVPWTQESGMFGLFVIFKVF